MTVEARSFDDVLADGAGGRARRGGSDLDVDGIDAAHKLSLLVAARLRRALSARRRSTPRASATSRQLDMAYARELGYVIKLLAIAKDDGDRSRRASIRR